MASAVVCIAMALSVIAFATSFAHALEWPGKKRLDRETYLTVQQIYYPGFTTAGIAEPLGILACATFLFVARELSSIAYLAATALTGLSIAHAIYWLVTHPVNAVWVKDLKMGKHGASFFDAGGANGVGSMSDWQQLRKQWEYSHIARSVFAAIALMALSAAMLRL